MRYKDTDDIFVPVSRGNFRSRTDPSLTWNEKFARNKVAANASPRRPCLVGDSICSNLTRYKDVESKFFPGWLNCGIGGDKIQHVLWRVQNNATPPSKAAQGC